MDNIKIINRTQNKNEIKLLIEVTIPIESYIENKFNISDFDIDKHKVEVLLPEDVQKILNIGKSKTMELFNSKSFPSYKIGRRWYVRKYELLKWLKEQRFV